MKDNLSTKVSNEPQSPAFLVCAVIGSALPCKLCNGRKTVPKFDWFDGKLKGSIKCWECNGGVDPRSWMDEY